MERSRGVVMVVGALALVGCAGPKEATTGHNLDETVVRQWAKSNSVEPRYEAVIAWVNTHRRAWGPSGSRDAGDVRAELDRRLGRRLARENGRARGRGGDGYKSRRFHTRPEGNVHARYTEDWETASGALSAEDILTLLVLDEVVRRPATVKELLRQSVLDRADKATEYGGVLRDSGPVLFVPEAHERGQDRAFVAPRAMFDEREGVLAHYHFHAQAEDNAEYAGPSAGDLDYAARHGQHCIVFTSVGKGRLDVDVYFPHRVVVDLGEISVR